MIRQTACRAQCPKTYPLEVSHKQAGITDFRNVIQKFRLKTSKNRLEIVVTDLFEQSNEIETQEQVQLISELLGLISFIMGIAFVATLDWIVAVLFWICRKLPFIPGMPPLLNMNVYPHRIFLKLKREYGATRALGPEIRVPSPSVAPAGAGLDSDVQDKTGIPVARFPRMTQRRSSMDIFAQAVSSLTLGAPDKRHMRRKPSGIGPGRRRRDGKQSRILQSAESKTPGPVSHSKLMVGNKSKSTLRQNPSVLTAPKITISEFHEQSGPSQLPSIGKNRRLSVTHSQLRRLTLTDSETEALATALVDPTGRPSQEERGRRPSAAVPGGWPSRGRGRRPSAYRSAPRRMTMVAARAESHQSQSGSEDEPS